MIVGTMIFRDKVRQLMDQTKSSALEVAEVAGVSDSQFYGWLSDKERDKNRKPTVQQMLRMSRHFNVTMESLADDKMDVIFVTKMREDETAVLDAYREARDAHQLTLHKAIWRLSVDPAKEGLTQRPDQRPPQPSTGK